MCWNGLKLYAYWEKENADFIGNITLNIDNDLNPFTPEVDIYARSSDWYCAEADQYGMNRFTDLAS